MYFTGTFAASQATDPAVFADLGMFAFPVLGNTWDAEMVIDAPTDGLMLSRSPRDLAGAKAILACVATGAAQLEYLASDPTSVAAAADADTSAYSDFQKQIATVLAGSKRIAQFLDRDARQDFVGQGGMQAFLKVFLATPNQSLSTYLRRVQAYYDGLAH